MFRAGVAALFAVMALALAACGSADAVSPDGDPGGIAMCAFDTPDCVDVVVEDEDPDQFDSEAARQEARDLIGATEGEVATADVRVGRRGEEQMMLTEDYVLGRHTVELDADADGVFRVTSVTTELPDGPETTR